ncbi:hypothetical protein CONCODRAFT_15665 [Conidiobolus coronatus NRRL 28638]|uniref:Uncharacterized protein n=1 Tax=Conidiobolus coronatus (strain ATCC 28846 / CBS 209.66 / NRRL 28638) TaxID=796925 RepID=A0A137PDY8_CONC2|nr:hypothetical protein CONCODRAFT_15665 [Conidiobolus coronatus NRRL 28638]|eukprot:KXN73182.1 hypothetical protein CONCODRAFT_15665 [Conidiobolus coronatus NRRL 28638]
MQQIVDQLEMHDEEVFMVIASVEQLNEIYMDDLDPQKRGTAVTTSLDEHDRFVVFGDGCRIVQRCVSPIDSLEYIVKNCPLGSPAPHPRILSERYSSYASSTIYILEFPLKISYYPYYGI